MFLILREEDDIRSGILLFTVFLVLLHFKTYLTSKFTHAECIKMLS